MLAKKTTGNIAGQGSGPNAVNNQSVDVEMAGDSPSPFPTSDKPARKPARVGSQPIIMALVFGVSATSIFAMRQYGARSGMVFADVVVDYKQEDAEKARTYERIMSDLARVQTPLDVALGEFGKSPFMLDDATSVVSADGTPQAGPSAEELAAAEHRKKIEARREEIRSVASRLQLNIVMGSLARIDGQNYREGDTIKEMFLVEKVDGRSVTLQAEGLSFVLSMEEHSSQQKKAPVKVAPKGNSRPK